MSQVLATFRSALGTALRSPMHVTVVLVVGTAAALAGVVVPLVPLVGLLAGPLFNAVILGPLVTAALVGSAAAVRNGGNAWNGAQSAVDDNWVDLVGAYGVVAVLWVVVGGALGLAFVVGAVGLDSLTELDSLRTGTTALLVALPSLAVLGLSVLAGTVLQFVGPAAVVADADAVESLRTAVRFSVANPTGVLGFSLVAFGVAVAASVPGAALAAVVWYVGNTGAAAVILAIGFLEAVTVAGAVTSVYLVEYFEAAADPSVLPGEGSLAATTDGVDTGGFEFGTVKNDRERL
ncbi:hypothetical protein JCM30237_11660 [Halolamina litorea]|uniref:DUF7847 domain-containing protein n=1 Tax=Halolamina litorea TaxID=1515593 RepID=A0ABD6BN04_9EURY|nr:hypothetical protein [Halolamina litorea]